MSLSGMNPQMSPLPLFWLLYMTTTLCWILSTGLEQAALVTLIDQPTMRKHKKIVAALHLDLTNEQRTVSATIAAKIFANSSAPLTENGDPFGLHGLSAVELLDQPPTLPHRTC